MCPADPCAAKKPYDGANNPLAGLGTGVQDEGYFNHTACMIGTVINTVEQSAMNVTKGYVGGFTTGREPITTTYLEKGLCPVNVHWHLGAEHLSEV